MSDSKNTTEITSGGDPRRVLSELASEINRAHSAATRDALSAVEHARRAGKLLNKARLEVRHGGWGHWLRAHCPELSERSAQRYMRLADLPAEKATRVSGLSLRAALAAIATPKGGTCENNGAAIARSTVTPQRGNSTATATPQRGNGTATARPRKVAHESDASVTAPVTAPVIVTPMPMTKVQASPETKSAAASTSHAELLGRIKKLQRKVRMALHIEAHISRSLKRELIALGQEHGLDDTSALLSGTKEHFESLLTALRDADAGFDEIEELLDESKR
jgi:hypothetical protein